LKNKILLLIILVLLLTSCNPNTNEDNGDNQILDLKDLTPLVSCLGYDMQAYQALGDLPNATIQGEIYKYDLPSYKGYYSGFNLRVWNENDIVKALYLKPNEQTIKIKDINIPTDKQKIIEIFGTQNIDPINSAFGMSQNNVQFYDDEYFYIFYLENNKVNAVEITTLETYQDYILVESEELNGEVIEYDSIDNLIVENYDGKLNNILDTYYFDCNSGESVYIVTMVGRFNDVELIYGKRESEAYILLESDIIEDSHIALGGAPDLSDEFLLALRFRDRLGQTRQVELGGKDNSIIYKNSFSDDEKVINNQILLDRITTYDNKGNEVSFVITKDNLDGLNNYLYIEFENNLELVASEKISSLQPKNGCITNPVIVDSRTISYTVTNTNDGCAPGLSYISKMVDLNTFRSEPFCNCSISFVLDEYYEPYIDHIIAKKFEVCDNFIEQRYYLYSPEGFQLAYLGNYIEPFYLLEQIEEAMEE
jgi:hypothetical protein